MVLSPEKFRVICYGGKSLNKTQQTYGISDLEGLAVLSAVKDLDCYLRYQHFTIVMDHKPLKQMLNNPAPPPGRWTRWNAWLMQYKFQIEYIPGSANKVADSLSRQKYSTLVEEDEGLDHYIRALKGNSPRNKLGRVINNCYIKNSTPYNCLSNKQRKKSPRTTE